MLLFVGRIQPLKGLTVAVGALAELSVATLTPCCWSSVGAAASGGAEEMAAVEMLIDRHGLHDRVRFVPPQPHHVLSTYYRAADVCIVPSRSESFGLVALEAAACGTPVVAAAVGGLRTLVDDGVTGFLVDSRDPIEYGAAVATLLDDPASGRQDGRIGRRAGPWLHVVHHGGPPAPPLRRPHVALARVLQLTRPTVQEPPWPTRSPTSPPSTPSRA